VYERAFMEEEMDPFDFALAEKLHMSIRAMRQSLGNDEYLAWRAFHVYRAAMRELEQERPR
jgi:hypothetical protein